MNVAIVGAGLTGLVAARRLVDLGVDVDLFEREAAVGGLIRSVSTDTGHFDLSGGHYLPLGDVTTRRWAARILPPDRWSVLRPAVRFLTDGDGGPRVWRRVPLRMVPAALRAAARHRDDPPRDLAERLAWTHGTPLATEWLGPWAERLWGVPLTGLEGGEGPLLPGGPPVGPMTPRWLRDHAEVLWDAHGSQPMGYPSSGGMQTFADAHLDEVSRVRTGEPVDQLERRDDAWRVNDDGPFDHVISTVHPTALIAAVGQAPDEVQRSADRLATAGTTVSYFVRDRSTPPRTPHRICYVVSGPGPFNRLVLRHDPSRGVDTIMADAAGTPSTEDVRSAAERLQLGRLVDIHHTTHAFPIPHRGSRQHAGRVTDWARERGIDQVGRWTWEPSSMVSAIQHGLAAANRAVHLRPREVA